MDKAMVLVAHTMINKIIIREIRRKIVAEAVDSINQSISTRQALKLVSKRIIKSVTKKMVTDIIQESTDTIYQFEDDSITVADFVLRSVLKQQIRQLLIESKQHLKQNKTNGGMDNNSSNGEVEIPDEHQDKELITS